MRSIKPLAISFMAGSVFGFLTAACLTIGNGHDSEKPATNDKSTNPSSDIDPVVFVAGNNKCFHSPNCPSLAYAKSLRPMHYSDAIACGIHPHEQCAGQLRPTWE